MWFITAYSYALRREMSSFEQNLPLFASPSSIIVSASTVIPLKTQLAYKILERGRMRFWLQAEHISSAVTYKFLANNNELSPTNPNHASHDVEAGIIEFVLDHFTEDSEGTFTVQIEDGKARGQSSLVLVGADFKAALADAEHQRSEYVRVKDGPHFSEFLSVHVGDDCSVALICKVDNLKKETALHWFKDGVEITPEGPVNLASGTCKLPISLVIVSHRHTPSN
ncbi:unnamed protein product [Oncorhynchus mykiss]|uniref:Ig-like domain-containing protein n=1 Tax=Oncorhynchus mykiss TaxID=8022 RepID=A0A060Z7F9_ONCMY|nr:unnamed protein product [Oncorhynchus mykiss]